MITTSVIPAAAASATTQNLVVEATERLCRSYCVLGTTPSATMSFKVGTVQTIGTTAIVPIIVTTAITSAQNGCGCAETQVFTETFNVGFTATATNTVTLTPGTSVIVTPANTRCCKAFSCKASTTLGITIA